MEDWRYIPVVKYLKFHYVNENDTDKELFFKEDWANLHTNLFWLKNKAAFHFQQSGPPLQQDPCNRVNLKKSINDINKRIKRVRYFLFTRFALNFNTYLVVLSQFEVALKLQKLHVSSSLFPFIEERIAPIGIVTNCWNNRKLFSIIRVRDIIRCSNMRDSNTLLKA